MVRGMYEVDEVAQLTGLRPNTIRRYCSLRTTLVRGRDHIVLRQGRFGLVRQKLLITKLGLLRIQTRDFVSLELDRHRRREPRASKIDVWERQTEERNSSAAGLDGRLRRRQVWIARLARALIVDACTHVGCLCKCHVLANACYKVIPSGLSAPSTFAF